MRESGNTIINTMIEEIIITIIMVGAVEEYIAGSEVDKSALGMMEPRVSGTVEGFSKRVEESFTTNRFMWLSPTEMMKWETKMKAVVVRLVEEDLFPDLGREDTANTSSPVEDLEELPLAS